MDGAQSLLAALADCGVSVCFANAGTTELPLVAALDREPRVRPVPALFEGVATGAADGFARITGTPALTLLHLGPGLANGSANLHNARRAGTPVVNLVGQHASWHLPYDAPLTSDVEGLARTTSVWVRTTTSADGLAEDARAAVAAAVQLQGPATLVVPADHQWTEVTSPAAAAAVAVARLTRGEPEPGSVGTARQVLASGRPAALLLGGNALSEHGLRQAQRVASVTGARLLAEKFPARHERGGGIPDCRRLSYFPEAARGALPAGGVLVLVGTRAPVTFFGYPGISSSEVPAGTEVVTLPEPRQDAAAALGELADALGAPGAPPVDPVPAPQRPTGALDVRTLGAAIAALQPEDAVVVDEGLTSSMAYTELAAGAPRHTCLHLTGGAIGDGMPLATGAALAAPGRRVVDLQADGSGLYTIQALWTEAREGLDVTTVVCANGTYRILQAELARTGAPVEGAAAALTDIAGPRIDWLHLAGGFGVPATRATTADELVEQLEHALREPGPALIEAVLP